MDPFSLGTSPTTVANSPLFELKTDKSREIYLADFLDELPNVIRERKDLSLVAGSEEDPIRSLFEWVIIAYCLTLLIWIDESDHSFLFVILL